MEQYLYVCYRRLPFCLATPPVFHVTRIAKGNLVPGMRSGDMCLTVALDVLMLSWSDLLLLCTSHMHINRDLWHNGESLERGCRCTTPAVLLLLYTVFVAARLNGCFCKKNPPLLWLVFCVYDNTHPTHIYTEAHTNTHRSTVRDCHKVVLLMRRSRQQIG